MPRERDPPYVAAGFRCDAEKLLRRFIAKSSLKFADFAEIWNDLCFSTIFMGREGLRELTEFIEECYRNALLFMDATNPYQKAGVVYLLFSLYLKQPPGLLRSQIPIRISFKQVLEMYNVENYFLDSATGNDDVLDLTYIITKLFKMEAFNITCFPIPMGPAVPIPLLRLEPLRNSSFKEMLGALRMFNDTNMKKIDILFKNQEIIKKQLAIDGSESTEVESTSKYEELKKTIDKFEDRYNCGLFPNEVQTVFSNKGHQPSQDLSQEKCSEPEMQVSDKLENEFKSLGQRRAMLKYRQFEMPAEYRKPQRFRPSSDSSENSQPEEEEEEEEKDWEPTPVKKKRGRPRKKKEVKKRKRKSVEDEAQTEYEAENGRDYSQSETGLDNTRMIARPVHISEIMHPVPFFPFRRPSKYPRPMRKLYFQSDDDKDEDY